MKTVKPGRVVLYIVAFLFAFLWLFPVLWMFVSSLKPYGTPVSILEKVVTGSFSFDNYATIISKYPILRWTFNSFFVAVFVTIGILIITSLAAYAISKLEFKFKNVVYAIIMAGMMVPIESIIIPLYQTMTEKGMLDSYIGLMCPSLAAPIGVLILKGFYDGIPKDLFEAAILDGANVFQRWVHVCLPMSKSSMAAVGIFTFTNSWNNFLWPFLSISSEKMMTLPVGIPIIQGANLSEFTLPMTASVIASVPAILMFLIFQKQIIKGIAMTGIKG